MPIKVRPKVGNDEPSCFTKVQQFSAAARCCARGRRRKSANSSFFELKKALRGSKKRFVAAHAHAPEICHSMVSFVSIVKITGGLKAL